MPDDLQFTQPRLIAGLGNPGARYENTRHNIGFLVLDHLAAALGCSFKYERRWQGEVAQAREAGLWLVKPQTYMNLSGESVAPLSRFHRIPPEQILAVVDDLDLPFGTLRLRPSGGSGGHNGMKSLAAHLGTGDFPRLRLGVGRPGGEREVVGHVLGKFSPEEQTGLDQFLKCATDCILAASRSGLTKAMSAFNRAPAAKPPAPPAGPSQISEPNP